jgi:ketosteroid isomerase-like protein
MSDSSSPPRDELRFRRKIFTVGCIVNLLLFAIMAVVCVVFIVAIASTFDRSSSSDPNSGTTTAFSKRDETAILAVLTAQVGAWNRGDLDGFMDGYWRDEKLRFTTRDEVKLGWNAARQYYIDTYKAGDKKMGRLSFSDHEIEGLTPELALVRGRYLLNRNDELQTGRFTLTFRKFPEGWKITSDHTSAAEKPAEKK